MILDLRLVMPYKLMILSVFLMLCLALNAEKSDSTHISFNGQVTAWGITQFETPVPTQFGGRFVPTLLGNFKLTPNTKLDFEALLNLNGSINFTGLKKDTMLGQLKPYRVWLRYSGDNWEVRAGLQKINFGSAKMFRPLMWFDAMDVRDPLQLTDGVYGVLGKYFFQNNANLWAWGLIGNKNPKGFEKYGTAQWKPEIGGRFELPAGPGEIALSTNHRTLLFQNPISSSLVVTELNESRIGLDGKWDVGIGLWFESSVTLTDVENINSPVLPKVQDMWNLGADYTLPIGSGMGVTLEYFRYHAGDKFVVAGNSVSVLGTMLTYPLSMLDNISGMVFYLPGQNMWMNYLSWARTYDNLSIYAIGYWNPDNVNLISAQSQGRNMFAGKGIQIMLNYNF
ncbi:MAG: hypothetical protein QM800_09425 [Paludibacter sp.]